MRSPARSPSRGPWERSTGSSCSATCLTARSTTSGWSQNIVSFHLEAIVWFFFRSRSVAAPTPDCPQEFKSELVRPANKCQYSSNDIISFVQTAPAARHPSLRVPIRVGEPGEGINYLNPPPILIGGNRVERVENNYCLFRPRPCASPRPTTSST